MSCRLVFNICIQHALSFSFLDDVFEFFSSFLFTNCEIYYCHILHLQFLCFWRWILCNVMQTGTIVFAQAFAWYYTRCGILYSVYMFFDSKYYTIWILVIKFFILFMLIFDNKRNIKDSEILNINHLLTLINILKNFAGL